MYTRENLKTNIASMVSGTITDADLNTIVNRAVREVLLAADLRSAKRKTTLSPGLFDDVHDYTCPIDLKGMGIIDIRPQINRGRFDQWRLTSTEEFDRMKQDIGLDSSDEPIALNRGQSYTGENLVAIDDFDMIRKLKIARLINDSSVTIDGLNSVGDWAGFGDGENVTADSDDFVKGSACLNWDIGSGGDTTAGIYNSGLTSIDISEFLMGGSIFVWVYIQDTDDITNFILRIGSSSSNYYYMTETTTNEGTSFTTGWNLLRFDLVDKTETGTVDDEDCTYCAIYMTKDAGKVSETDYRFDNIVLRRGEKYAIIYYSKYSWQSNAAVYLENSTDDTDYLNVDTDEMNLIELKAAELGERYLRNQGEANNFRTLFMTDLGKYVLNTPSEALVMTTTYHFT